ncbi:MAG: DHHW family protein [Candidatus Limivicinus sp.]|nr:DHHW family protein [Clostridiales bacterium]MDY6133568.1 DHHW family protein [Candidatus Limivicinus sp.]
MKHRASLIIVYLCLLSLFTLGAAELLLTDKEERASLTENRMLQGFPQLSAQSVLSGSFMEDFEAFLSDGFFGRDKIADVTDGIMGLFRLEDEDAMPETIDEESLFQLSQEETEEAAPAATPSPAPSDSPEGQAASDAAIWLVNAAGEQVDYQRYSADSIAHLAQVLDEYRACLPEDGTVNFVCAPTSELAYSIVNGNYTDWGSDVEEVLQPLVADGVLIYDATDILRPHLKEETLYPITDHHWHPVGANYVLSAMLERQGVVTADYYEYDYYLASRPTGGAYDRRALENMAVDINDVPVMKPIAPVESYVLTNLTERQDCVFIDRSDVGYRQYLGGTYTPWRLFITGYHTGRNALVIGDSFSNAFIPYLTPYYDQIISTDFRRGKYVSSLAGASAADYIAEYGVDDIYMIYCTYTPIDSSTMQQYMESYLHMEY